MNILLVDSDSNTIAALLPALKTLPGAEVRAATTGDLALQYASEWGHVDWLVTEVFLEPMNGFTLSNKLQNRFSALRVVFCSEYDLEPYKEHTEGHATLKKPVNVQELMDIIGKQPQVLSSEGAPQAAVEPAAAGPEQPVVAPPPHPQPTGEPLPSPPEISHVPVAPSPLTPIPTAQMPVSAPPEIVSEPRIPESPAPAPEPDVAPQPQTPSVSATPRAVPAAVPKPVAVPQARAVPAQPTAKPVAVPQPGSPQATPVARPTATPAQPTSPQAKPTAVPVARPAGQPTAVPVARPTAQPTATPVARPTAQPAAQPTAVPAKPTAVPSATPKVAQAPKAVPVAAKPAAVPAVGVKPVAARPAAVQAGVAPKPVVAARPAPVAAQAAPDPLVGQSIGNYKILRRIVAGETGTTYQAEQTSMNRHVAMKILSAELAGNPEAKKQFIANASAKANVQHPKILSVYEAGEAGGHCFYTHEYVDGSNLEELRVAGRTIDEPAALQVVKVVAEGLAHLAHNRVPHRAVTAGDIYLGNDKHARLGNIAAHLDEQPDLHSEMRTVADAVTAVLPGGRAQDQGLQGMLTRMRQTGPQGFASWPALLQTVKALEPKVVPADAYKISARDQAAIAAVEDAKRRQKRQLLFSIAGAAALAVLSALAVWFTFFRSNEKNLDIMVEIPAGPFIYQNGEKKTLPAFYIGKYEVTIGQYARFLRDLEENPSTAYDHPKQPKGKSHIPQPDKTTWETYYNRARWGKPARFVPISLNSPIFNIDYWDAYAYAKWRGGRLPTEEEWEKAARGTDGRLYPWGNELELKRANTNVDYIQRPGPNAKADVDGHWWWAPVDEMTGDTSPFGAVSMLGNLSEWTDSWANDKFPVIRGSNFRAPPQPLTHRIIESDPELFTESLGFRIASDQPLPRKQ